MPKRGNRSRGKRGFGWNNLSEVTVRMPFRTTFNLVSESSGFNTNYLLLTAAHLGSTASVVATCFEFFKVTKMRVRFVPGTMAVNSEAYQFAAAYSSEVEITSGPGGMSDMAQMPGFVMSDGRPMNLTVPARQLLATPLKWFRCNTTGSPAADEITQGIVFLASLLSVSSTASLTFVALVEGMVSFKNPIAPADAFSVPRALKEKPNRVGLDGSDDEKEVVHVVLPP